MMLRNKDSFRNGSTQFVVRQGETPATLPTTTFRNGVQEELASVIEFAEFTPGPNNMQFLASLDRIRYGHRAVNPRRETVQQITLDSGESFLLPIQGLFAVEILADDYHKVQIAQMRGPMVIGTLTLELTDTLLKFSAMGQATFTLFLDLQLEVLL